MVHASFRFAPSETGYEPDREKKNTEENRAWGGGEGLYILHVEVVFLMWALLGETGQRWVT